MAIFGYPHVALVVALLRSLSAMFPFNFVWRVWASFAPLVLPQPPSTPQTKPITFHLRGLHSVASHSGTPRIIFADPSPSLLETSFTVPTRPTKVHRPHSHEMLSRIRRGSAGEEEMVWVEDISIGPDVEDRLALLTLAKMTYNAYLPHENKTNWYDVEHWEERVPVGWEPADDSIRGHLFVSDDHKTVVISIKGTSLSAVIGGEGGPTTTKDKLNDNLLFSCCCSRVDWTWTTVCPCYAGGWKCDSTCLERSLVQDEGLYYPLGINLYQNVSYLYPDANIWIVGHSLGGGLSSLIGITFGAHVVAFESPAAKLAAKRLHLPTPPSLIHVTQVYNTADPVPMGTCTGTLSTCAIAGLALETRCHVGQSIVYDTITKLGWHSDARSHLIKVLIDNVLSVEADKSPWVWTDDQGRAREVPPATIDEECFECSSWEYGEFGKTSSSNLLDSCSQI